MSKRMLLAAVVAALLAAPALAQVPPAVQAPPGPEKPKPGEPVFPAAPVRDVQDLVFFGESRPVLVRLHLLLGGKPFQDAWDDLIGDFFKHLDLDGDGVLTKKEMERVPQAQDVRNLLAGGFNYYDFNVQFAKADQIDTDKDGKVTREELIAYYRRGGVTSFRADLSGQRNASGQLTTTLFRELDTDKTGKLTKEKFAAAPVVLRKKDSDDDEMISRTELSPPTNPYGEYVVVGGMGAPGGQQNLPVLLIQPGEPVSRLTRQLVALYDKDRNQKLSAKELDIGKEAFDALDANHDGELDAAELVKFAARPADLELMAHMGQNQEKAGSLLLKPLLELAKMTAKKSPLEVFSPDDRKQALAAAVKKEDAALVLTLSDARVDLRANAAAQNNTAATKQFYKQQFDALDKDKNGYLDRKEAEQDGNGFLRGLFVLADRDGDGKLYEKELMSFLDLAGKAAEVTTVLSVTDQGRGLFELLDANGDGKLGIRECRTAWERLAAWDHDGDGKLDEKEVPKFYQLSLGQGQLGLPYRTFAVGGFGFMGRTPAAPKGPAWFRKMDRNGDGDVSPREWLGTEEEFQRLDADGDGLISADEADKAEAQAKKEKAEKP